MDSDYGITSLTGLSMISHSTFYLLAVLVGVSSVKGLSVISCSIFLTYGTHGRYNWLGRITYMSGFLKMVLTISKLKGKSVLFSLSTRLSPFHCHPFSVFLPLHGFKAALRSSEINVKCG